jgi:hypothetical protein
MKKPSPQVRLSWFYEPSDANDRAAASQTSKPDCPAGYQ